MPARGSGSARRSKLSFAAPTSASAGPSDITDPEESVASSSASGFSTISQAKPFLDGYVPATVPRVGQKAMQRQPGPGQYDVRGGPLNTTSTIQGSAFGEQIQPAVDLRSLVNKSQAAVPSSHSYEPKFQLPQQPQVASAFVSATERFQETDTQKTQNNVPVDYSGEHGFVYGSVAHSVSKAAQMKSSMFASTVRRSSWVPESDEEKAARQQAVIREAQEKAARQAAWEAELQRQREADPEWQAMEAARLAEEEEERLRIEKAAADAAARVERKEREEHKQAWLAARAAEEWAWKQAEEEAEEEDKENPSAPAKRRALAEERKQKKQAQKVGALWSWNEADEDAEDDDDNDEASVTERAREERRQAREEEAREARIAARAAELVRAREDERQAEAAEAAEIAATIAAERAATRLRQAQEEERERSRAAFEAWMAAEAARDPDEEALRVAEAAMTAEQRARSFAEREERMAQRAAEQAAWEVEEARKLAEEERAIRKVYEEARAAEKERLEAEEKVRRAAERERQALAVQDWSWQEAMEMAFDASEKVKAAEALRMERSAVHGIGAVKSRQKMAEEKSLARSQISRASGFGTQSSAAFASTASRFGDKSTDEAMKYVNPELRAKQKTHDSMMARSRKRAARLNEAVTVMQRYARRRVSRRELLRRVRRNELHVAAPPLQALVRGWKVRARLKWCASIATILQRWTRGMLGRRLARWQRERVPTIQAAARGLIVRVQYRAVRGAVISLEAGVRGMRARGRARGLRNDPEKIRRWGILVRVREEVNRVHVRLNELAEAREAEQSQLKLALAHEVDKLGASCKDAPQVAVMLKQEKLAERDSAEIAVAIKRAANLIALLAKVPFNRAGNATAAVAEEVEWLLDLAEHQMRRDELYKPQSHRITDLFGSPPSKTPLTRAEQLDSYRSVSRGEESHRDAPLEEEVVALTEAEIAAERARRQAARRASSGGGVSAMQMHAAPAPKKWTGKGPPPPGWNKVRAPVGPPPPGFKGSSSRPSSRAGSPAGSARSRSASPRPAASKPSSRSGSPAVGRSPAASPAASRSGSPQQQQHPLGPSPVPSLAPFIRTLAGGSAPGVCHTPASSSGQRSAASNPFASSRSGTTASTASLPSSVRSAASFASFGGASEAGSACSSVRSTTSSGAGSTGSRGRIQPKPRKPATQLDFEQQRLARMARAAQAKEQETLEKAKRQAQRSKRVAGFIIDPKKLAETKRQREREALEKIAGEKAEKLAKEASEMEAKKHEKAMRAEKAGVAEKLALERLRERKAEERRKAQAMEQEAALQREAELRHEEEQRQAKAEQRRLRKETSFFSRTDDGHALSEAKHTSSLVGLQGPQLPSVRLS